jgi:hypothetical protein
VQLVDILEHTDPPVLLTSSLKKQSPTEGFC